MPKVLVLSGSNHAFDTCAPLIAASLKGHADLDVTLADDKSILASPQLSEYDVLVHGTGFTYRERKSDGSVATLPYLTDAEERGLFNFVRGGKGFIGIHGTAWWIGGEPVNLVGGHANWHPQGLEFGVHVEDTDHPITLSVGDFTVSDEIYMSAWDPSIHILATATWADRKHPILWTHAYGNGKVFFCALGHGPSTFENGAVLKLLGNACEWAAG